MTSGTSLAGLLAASLLSWTAGAETAPLFVDVTTVAGIDFVHQHGGSGRKYLPETMGSGGCVLDFDGDGRMDLYLVQSGPLPGDPTPSTGNRLLRNRGQGADGQVTFEDVTAGSGAEGRGYGQGAVCADYDGDGDSDLYLTHFGANQLLRNEGGGRFRDVTAETGTGDPRWSSSAAFFDADADGDLDLYVVNYLDFTLETHRDCRHVQAGALLYCHPDAYAMAPDTLYRNRGDGTFEDATAELGFTDRSGKGMGIVVVDLDNDGGPEVYVTNDSTPNFVYRRGRDGRYEEIGLLYGGAYNQAGQTEAGMGVDAGDVNGDGFFDLVVTNLSLETNTLYLGSAAGLTDATRQSGLAQPSYNVLGFGTDLLDLDLDGDLDLVVANGDVLDNVELINDALRWQQPGQAFLNDGQGRFSELPAAQTGDLAIPRVARGTLTLDFDDDGRLDLLVLYNRDRARLYRNQAPPGNWIGFHLRATGANPGAVGARVTLEAGGRRQFDEVKAGSGYQSSSDPRLHFGLGPATQADRITIRWPNGQLQTLGPLPAGRYHFLHQPR